MVSMNQLHHRSQQGSGNEDASPQDDCHVHLIIGLDDLHHVVQLWKTIWGKVLGAAVVVLC